MGKLPPVSGKITFDALPSTLFWIRVLELEDEVAFIQAKINEKPKRRMASVPIISEYIVEPGRMIFYFAMHLKIDALGVQSGVGVIYCANAANAEECEIARNKVATKMLNFLSAQQPDEWEECIVGKEK